MGVITTYCGKAANNSSKPSPKCYFKAGAGITGAGSHWRNRSHLEITGKRRQKAMRITVLKDNESEKQNSNSCPHTFGHILSHSCWFSLATQGKTIFKEETSKPIQLFLEIFTILQHVSQNYKSAMPFIPWIVVFMGCQTVCTFT